MTQPVRIAVLASLLLALPALCAPRLSVKPIHVDSPRVGFPDDWVELTVTDGGQTLAADQIYTSYGSASCVNVTDARGAAYALLRHGRGRGTNVRLEYLTVYRLDHGLEEILRLPIAGPAGTFSRWEYHLALTRPADGGLLLTLTRHIDGHDAHLFPPSQTRTIRLGGVVQ